jgi:hypothetical protein
LKALIVRQLASTPAMPQSCALTAGAANGRYRLRSRI